MLAEGKSEEDSVACLSAASVIVCGLLSVVTCH